MNISIKARCAFRVATTSFIYPADYVTNARRLAPLVDEIELLFFESRQLPHRDEIRQLAEVAKDQNITYNVHLPMDIDLAAESAAKRQKSIDKVARAIEQVATLSPTTQTLHLMCSTSDMDEKAIGRWQDFAIESITELLKTSGTPSRNISVETLDYNPFWLNPVVETVDLSVCVDAGHVILYGFDLKRVLESFKSRTTILHLHGVAEGKDHLALTQLHPSHCRTIAGYLQDFAGSASIEVFDLKRLSESLEYLPRLMDLSAASTPS